jgi:hypothetical protein
MMESGRQGIGAIPSPGLQGAEDGVERHAVCGPVEHRSLTSEMVLALNLDIRVEYREAGRVYFRLRLHAAQLVYLHSARKR